MASSAPVPGAGLLHKLDAFNNCVLGCVLVPGRDVLITISAPRCRTRALHTAPSSVSQVSEGVAAGEWHRGRVLPGVLPIHHLHPLLHRILPRPEVGGGITEPRASPPHPCVGGRQLFVGAEDGTVEQWRLGGDWDSLDSVRVSHAHTAPVTALCPAPGPGWLLSTGRDSCFTFHCSDSGARLGGYTASAPATSLAYDHEVGYVFIGEQSGAITVCKLEQGGAQFVNTLKVTPKTSDKFDLTRADNEPSLSLTWPEEGLH